jgi:hypothetical protein
MSVPQVEETDDDRSHRKVALVPALMRHRPGHCARLAEAGADIVLNFVSSPLQRSDGGSHRRDGHRVAVVQADVSEPDDVESMIRVRC